MIQIPAGTSIVRLQRLVQIMAHDTDTCWDEHSKASEISTNDGTAQEEKGPHNLTFLLLLCVIISSLLPPPPPPQFSTRLKEA